MIHKCICTVIYNYLDLYISSSLFPELFWLSYVQNTLLFGCLIFKQRRSFVWRRGLIWKILGNQRTCNKECAGTDTNIFLSKLRCIFFFFQSNTHSLSFLSPVCSAGCPQGPIFSPIALHANIIAAHVGNWSA